tara:strand:- start:32 stop:226 length:195 start_codon:yes stop_codon:yes gene_type:complete
MAKKYFSLNEVPIGTKMIVKSTEEEVELIEIQNFPTTFIAKSHDGKVNKYLTHQVDILDWPKEN